MESKRAFLKCMQCNNIVTAIENGGGSLSCCGEPMHVLVAGEIEAAQEKHIPVCKVSENKLTVEVGEVLHPMIEEHYIQWIAVDSGDHLQIKKLSPGQAPIAEFSIEDGDITVYEYCNLHGLWKSNL